MANPVNLAIVGALGTAVALQTVQMLVEKKLINEQDGFEIYARATKNFTDPAEKAEAVKVLQAYMPGLKVRFT